ncbi:SRPBCC family protein [Aerosakkonemataceae cyanobacterium BLCC-F50]|uniref:SRPBCC family protein n=1 Tax=Floridaenema flaviceps BLCC-F50 TaxID=3153642 RepID=A0ABV4XZR8_9CYAN
MEDIRFSIKKGQRYKRYLSVEMLIPYSREQVWRVITSYDTLSDFIPNVVKSRLIPNSENKLIFELVGFCEILNFPFSLRTVLEVVENYPYAIDTQMIEGDLQSYSGQWRLEEIDQTKNQIILSYSAEIVPKLTMPIALLERQLNRLLPVNFLAISQRLDMLHSANHQIVSFK